MTEKTITPQTEGFSADTLAETLNDEAFVIGDDGQTFQLAQATDGTPVEEGTAEATESAEDTGASQPTAPAAQTIVQIEIGADGSVRLPAGTSLAQAQVSGDDLRLIQPDGTVYVIVGAISDVPAIYIGDVQIPAQTLADALAAQGINIALDGDAGTEAPDSSGNNFQATHPGISPPFDLTPLLPPTALAFPILEQPELLEPLRQEDENQPPVVGTTTLAVSEEGLPDGNPDSVGVDDTTNSTTANGVLPVSDPDGDPLTIMLGEPTPALTSNGHDVLWDGVDTNALIGYVDENDNGIIDAGDTPIITITIDNDGNISVVLDGHVDHADPTVEDDFDLTVPVFVDDGTDVVTSSFTVTIEDDSPLIIVDGETIIATVKEDGLDATPDGDDVDLSTGNIDSGETDTDDQASDVLSGSLTTLVSGGADTDATFSIDTGLSPTDLPTLYSKGDPVSYSVSPDGMTLTAEAGGRTVFTLVVNPDGTWTFDLDDQLDHVDNGLNDENFALITSADSSTSVDSIDFSLVITVTDADGDSVSIDFPDAFKIFVQDDIPVVNPQGRIAVTVDEDGLAGANIDGGQPGEVNGGGSTTATGLAGALNALVFDGADEDVEFGLSVDNNTDGAALVAALGLKSNGFDVDDAVVAGNVITAISSDGRDIFKLTINADGSYEFELLDQVDQPGNSLEDLIAIDLSDFIAAIDFDGDQVSLGDAVFLVTIFDDIPTVDITDTDPTMVVEGGTINGTWTNTPGADQPAAFNVIVNGTEYDVDTGIPVEVGGQTLGTLTVASDGTWEFVSNPDVDQSGGDPQFTFTIRITDADDDVHEDSHTVSVKDGADPTAGTLMLQVEEQALDTAVTGDDDSGDLAPGNVDGTDPDLLTETASGNLQFTAGSDDITSFAFADPAAMAPTVLDADGNVVAVSWSLVGDQLIGKIGGVTAIIIDFTAPASITSGTSDNVVVTATLTDAFPHASPVQPDADLVTISDIKIIASDGDDTATGVVTVKIVDDIPDVEVTVNGQGNVGDFALNLDETYLPDAPAGEDRYNVGETPQDNDGDLDDVVGDPDRVIGRLATDVTGGLGSLFTIASDAGADGQASLTHQLSFVFTDATPDTGLETTLIDLKTGKTIHLFLEADGSITGRVGGQGADGLIVLTISILNATDPANAQLQFEQIGVINHGGEEDPSIFDEIATLLTADTGDIVELQLTSTLTDNDGDVDVSSASIAIITDTELLFSIDDDGPANNDVTNTALLVHEDALDSADPGVLSDGNRENPSQTSTVYIAARMLAALVDFGSDGEGSFLLNDAIAGSTGLTSLGFDVDYVYAGGEISGVADGRTVFTLVEIAAGSAEYLAAVAGGVIANGEQLFKFTLLDQVDNDEDADLATGEGETQTESFDLAGAFVAVDGDGDSLVLNGGLPVSIENDVPVPFTPETAFVLNVASATDTADLNFDDAIGADEPGTTVFNLTGLATDATGVLAKDQEGRLLFTASGDQIYLVGDGTGTLVGVTDPSDVAGTTVFTIVLDPTTDSFDVTVSEPISNGTEINVTDLTGVGGGNVQYKALLNSVATDDDVLISTTPGELINTNATDIGISTGNSFEGGEQGRFDFVTDLAIDGGSPTGFSYTDHVSVSQFSQKVEFVLGGPGNTADFRVTAIIADNDDTFIGDPSGESAVNLAVTDIRIYEIVGGVEVDRTGSVLLIDEGNSILIEGMEEGWYYEITSTTSFNAVEVEAATGTLTFKLGVFSFTTINDAEPIDFTAPIIGEDYDGDSVDSDIQITFLPADTIMGTSGNDSGGSALIGTADNDVIAGLDGDDELSGLGGDDILLGGSGTDTLTGDSGADTFVISDTLSIDVITDYVFGIPGVGDMVDLTGLFTADIGGADPNTDQLSDFVKVVEVGGGAVDLLQVDVDGGGDSFVTVATLNGDAGVTIIYDDDGTEASAIV